MSRKSHGRSSASIKPLKSQPARPAVPAQSSTPVRNSPIPRPEIPQKSSPRPIIVTDEMIAHRAYEIWQSGGGSEFDNWLRAEKELRG
jgi:hypothetical protein